MRSFFGAPALQAVLALAVPVIAAAAQTPSRPPVQSSPFVGTWVLNVAKSTYEGIPEDRRRSPSTRTIDVQGDGVFVETHRNATKSRGQGFFHWVGKPDGPEITEYSRQGGTRPGNKLTIKTVHERQWSVTFRNQQGQVVLTDTWTVSPDGRTLTIDRRGTPPNGPPNHSVEVYENDGWAMPRNTR